MIDVENDYVFILGDSRTGTTSLHLFFEELGLPSKHYFVEEAGLIGQVHTNYEVNKRKALNYIDKSGFRCFSDYPTRPFYKELHEKYPSAYFILSKRASDSDWKNSMLNFFKNSHDMDIEKVNKLFKHYKTINCDIRTYFESKPTTKFMELVIDSQSASDELSKFLGLSSTKELKKKNSSKA